MPQWFRSMGLVGLVSCLSVASASAQDVERTVQELEARTDVQAAEIAELKADKAGASVDAVRALAVELTGSAAPKSLNDATAVVLTALVAEDLRLAGELAALSQTVDDLGAGVVANSEDLAATSRALSGMGGALEQLQKKVAQLSAAIDNPGTFGFVLQGDGTYQMVELFAGSGPVFQRSNVDAGIVGFGGDADVFPAVAALVGDAEGTRQECWEVFSAYDASQPLTTAEGVPVLLCAHGPQALDVAAKPGEIRVDAYDLLSLYLGRKVQPACSGGGIRSGGDYTCEAPKIKLNP